MSVPVPFLFTYLVKARQRWHDPPDNPSPQFSGPRTHPVDEVLPVGKLTLYGFQHVLAFYAAAVIVPILVGNALGLTHEQLVYLINADLLTCGIASIIQALGIWKIGARLPLVQGVTFTRGLPDDCHRPGRGGGVAGLLVVYGAVITAGIRDIPVRAVLQQAGEVFSAGRHRHDPHHHRSHTLIPQGLQDAPGGAQLIGHPEFGSGKNLAYALGTLLFILAVVRLGSRT